MYVCMYVYLTPVYMHLLISNSNFTNRNHIRPGRTLQELHPANFPEIANQPGEKRVDFLGNHQSSII